MSDFMAHARELDDAWKEYNAYRNQRAVLDSRLLRATQVLREKQKAFKVEAAIVLEETTDENHRTGR